MKSKELLDLAIQTIDSFDPKRTTVDAHCDSSPALKKLPEFEAKFVTQVFYGCVRYQKFLRVFVTGFLYKNPSKAQRSDQTLYTVLAYLLIFRLEELGHAEFRNFILCGSPVAMLAFLEFAASPEDLNAWVKMEWCKLYDIEYIEHDIIGTIQRLLPADHDLINEISIKALGVSIKQEKKEDGVTTRKMHTVPEPFALTKPRPRLIPLPEPIPRNFETKPVDPIVYKNSLAKVDAKGKKRQEGVAKATAAKYSAEEEFTLQTANRCADIDKIRETLEAEKFAECSFKPDLAKPFKPSQQVAECRLNTAAVLREDALLTKKQEKEFEILKRYESDLRDCSDYYKWQHEQRVQDQLDDQGRIELRKVEMKMSRADALVAQAAFLRRNNLVAMHQKEDMKAALDVVEHEKHEDLKRKQQLTEDMRAERINPRIAEQIIVDARALHAEELRKQTEVDLERQRKEREYEMAKKTDLIRQIRAVARVSVVRPMPYDPSEPPRHGLLAEMSLAELHERLAMMKAAEARAVERKRQDIIDSQNEKSAELTTKAKQCAKIREMAKVESEQRRGRQLLAREHEEREKLKVREESVLRAQEKIAAKKTARRQEENRLKRELKEISTKRQFLQANAEMVEQKAYEEQQKGLEREAKARQEVQIREEARRNEIARAEMKKRKLNRRNEDHEHRQVQAAYNVHMELARIDDEVYTAEIRKASKTARELQKKLETKLLATQRRDKPYNAKRNDAIRRQVELTQQRSMRSVRSDRSADRSARLVTA